MEGLQPAIEIGRGVGNKVHPILEFISVKIATFVDVSSENVHLLILFAIALYLSSITFGRNSLGIMFWIGAVGIWYGFKYFGF